MNFGVSLYPPRCHLDAFALAHCQVVGVDSQAHPRAPQHAGMVLSVAAATDFSAVLAGGPGALKHVGFGASASVSTLANAPTGHGDAEKEEDQGGAGGGPSGPAAEDKSYDELCDILVLLVRQEKNWIRLSKIKTKCAHKLPCFPGPWVICPGLLFLTPPPSLVH